MRERKTNALYIHIPFCTHICSYCDFPKVLYDTKWVMRYIECLKKEILSYGISSYQTIYIGGGTPSSLKEEELESLLSFLCPFLEKDYEWTIECNIENTTLEKLKLFKKYGVNRLSFGVQTFQEDLLKKMNRYHHKEDVFHVIEMAKSLGFTNINVDFIYGFENEKVEDVLNDLKIFASLDVPHISIYALTIHPNTIFGIEHHQEAEDELSRTFYDVIVNWLEEHGYNRYEVSNFARPGYESKHNQVYWTLGEYLGFGLAAHSFVDGKRIANSSCFEKYLSQKNAHRTHVVSQDEVKEEFVMLALRTREGIDLKKYQKQFGVDLLEEKKDEIVELKNFIDIKDGHLVIKPKEFGKTNLIILKLI